LEETNLADLQAIVRALAEAAVRTETRLQTLAAAQERTDTRLETLTARVDTLALRMEELTQAQTRTEAHLDTLTARVDTLTEHLDALTARMNTLTEHLDALTARVDTLTEHLDALTARVDTLTERMDTLTARVDTLTEHLDALTARVDTLTERMDTLTARVDTLTEHLDALTARVDVLTARMETLALRMDELAQAQLRTEDEVARLRRTIETQIGGLGARWGMQTEEAFRQAMKTILEEVGFQADRYLTYDTTGEVFGHPDQVELDVVIHNGTAIVIEIKSSLDRGQVYLFSRKVAFYQRKTGQQVTRQVIVTPFAEQRARDVAGNLGVEICTDVSTFQ
jgi:hypothetical protein